MEEENKSQTFDPWAPRDAIKPIQMGLVKDPRRDMPSSESYIASLESKLSKMKSKKTCTSKDMIKSLSKAKDDHMDRIIPVTDYDMSEIDNSSRLSQIQRRIIPQQPLTDDELKALVENDELAKLMESIRMEMEHEQLQSASPSAVPATGACSASESSNSKSMDASEEGSRDIEEQLQCTEVSVKEARQESEKDICEKNGSDDSGSINNDK